MKPSKPSIEFLKHVLGEDGQKAFEKADKRSGGIGVVLGPRAIIGWLSAAIKANFEGEIPGLHNSYISLQKHEANSFSGVLTIGEQVHSFNEADILHVAANIAVALGIEDLEIPQHLKNSDISKLGKSIDMLVKARVIAKALSQDLQKNLQPPTAQAPAPTLHNTVEGFFQQLKATPGHQRGSLIQAHLNHPPFQAALAIHPQQTSIRGTLLNFLDSKANAGMAGPKKISVGGASASIPAQPVKKAAMTGGEQPGPAAKPHGAIPPTSPLSPKATAPTSPPTLKSATSMTKKELLVKKADSERVCQECESLLFKNDKFTGCLCFKTLAKSVKTTVTPNGYSLSFNKSQWDSDTFRALVQTLMGGNDE